MQFQRNGRRYAFGYGRSYLNRPDAISLYTPELPLRAGWQIPSLTTGQARDVIDWQIELIERDWMEVTDLAKLTQTQRNLLWHRQILNLHTGYGYMSGA